MKKILIGGLLGLLVLLAIGGGVLGTLYFTGNLPGQQSASAVPADGAAAEQLAPVPDPEITSYVSLDPPFTVSFSGPSMASFLQVAVEVGVSDSDGEEAIKTHKPAIRNGLVMLLSGQDAAELDSRAGKERLRQLVRDEVREILTDLAGEPYVVDVFFTSFLMQ